MRVRVCGEYAEIRRLFVHLLEAFPAIVEHLRVLCACSSRVRGGMRRSRVIFDPARSLNGSDVTFPYIVIVALPRHDVDALQNIDYIINASSLRAFIPRNRATT